MKETATKRLSLFVSRPTSRFDIEIFWRRNVDRFLGRRLHVFGTNSQLLRRRNINDPTRLRFLATSGLRLGDRSSGFRSRLCLQWDRLRAYRVLAGFAEHFRSESGIIGERRWEDRRTADRGRAPGGASPSAGATGKRNHPHESRQADHQGDRHRFRLHEIT